MNLFQILNHLFYLIDYLYVADTRTRAIFEMRKRDGGGNIMIRQGITGIMNIKAYTADLHSSMFTSNCSVLIDYCSPRIHFEESYVKGNILAGHTYI